MSCRLPFLPFEMRKSATPRTSVSLYFKMINVFYCFFSVCMYCLPVWTRRKVLVPQYISYLVVWEDCNRCIESESCLCYCCCYWSQPLRQIPPIMGEHIVVVRTSMRDCRTMLVVHACGKQCGGNSEAVVTEEKADYRSLQTLESEHGAESSRLWVSSELCRLGWGIKMDMLLRKKRFVTQRSTNRFLHFVKFMQSQWTARNNWIARLLCRALEESIGRAIFFLIASVTLLSSVLHSWMRTFAKILVTLQTFSYISHPSKTIRFISIMPLQTCSRCNTIEWSLAHSS